MAPGKAEGSGMKCKGERGRVSQGAAGANPWMRQSRGGKNSQMRVEEGVPRSPGFSVLLSPSHGDKKNRFVAGVTPWDIFLRA